MAYKTILALDQATRDSGWSVFVEGQLINFGHWSFTYENLSIRIFQLCQEVKKKIEEYHPDMVIIENIQLQQNVEMFQKLAWVQGALMTVCNEMKVPHKLVYPSEWRKNCSFLKGNDKHRENQKKIAQQWVMETFNKKCTQDESDAICIGYSESLDYSNAIEFD